MARSVLVTGAGGFIGSHLCERLVRDGSDVRALCRYTSERSIGNLAHVSRDVREALDISFGDLLDPEFVGRAVADREAVFHLGASISVPYSYVAPREVVTTNVLGTLNVLTAAVASGAERVVQLSSSEVYGTAQYVPIDEDHPLHAQSPYAASKVGADKLAETFQLSFSLPVVIARPFNTFGPRQSARAVIPTIVMQALAGDVIHLGTTGSTRDFVFVADTVEALASLAATDEHCGETFNISTGEDFAIASVVEIVGETLDRELRVVQEEERIRPPASEVYRLVGSAAKLERSLAWKPRTTFRDGIASVVEWIASRDNADRRYRI